MKYGMNMLLWTGDCTTPEFPALFERLKKTGFDLVEIPIFDPNPKKLAALAKKLDDPGRDHVREPSLSSIQERDNRLEQGRQCRCVRAHDQSASAAEERLQGEGRSERPHRPGG